MSGVTGYGRFFAKFWLLGFPLGGFLIGKKLDDMETLRMTRFRDKSALYGRELKSGEQPSWPGHN